MLKNKIITLLACTFSAFIVGNVYANSSEISVKPVLVLPVPVQPAVAPVKQKVAVLSMRRGGASTSAALAIKHQLASKYEVTIVNVFEDVFSSLDLTYKISRGKYTGDDFFVGTCRVAGEWIANPLQSFGEFCLRMQDGRITSLIEKFLRDGNYNMVISVVPFINYAMYKAARVIGIPSMVMMLDIDANHWLNGMQKTEYAQFTFGLLHESTSLREKLIKNHVPGSCIKVVGLPLKQAFLRTADVPELKREFSIPANKPVVMVMMGGEGSPGTWLYARALAQSPIALHACILTGRDEGMRNKINALKLKEGVTFTVAGFTDRISDYMAVADLLITKPGPLTIFEAICRRVPMIIDHTGTTRERDIPAINFVVHHSFGMELRDIKKLPHLLHCFLQDTSFSAVIKQTMEKYTLPKGAENIEQIVDSMLMAKK